MLPRTTTFSRIWNLSPSTLDELRREFDNAVGSVSGAVSRTCSNHPPLTVWENDAGVVFEVEVPGFRQEDLDVSVEDGVLTISGTRKPSSHDGELKYSDHRRDEFTRSLQLVDSLDPTSVSADLEDGVLVLSIARRVEAQPKKIPVEIRSRSGCRSEELASSDTPAE